MTEIDDFEDGDVAEYSLTAASYNEGNFSASTNHVYNGSYAGKVDVKGGLYSPGEEYRSSGSGSGLNYYPSKGDKFHAWIYISQAGNPPNAGGVMFGWDKANEVGYCARIESDDTLILQKGDALSETELASASATYYSDTWLKIEVDWQSDDTITVTIYDDAGNSLGSVSATDSDYANYSGFGWMAKGGDDTTTASVYTDYAIKPSSTSSVTEKASVSVGSSTLTPDLASASDSVSVGGVAFSTATGEFAVVNEQGGVTITSSSNILESTSASENPVIGTTASVQVNDQSGIGESVALGAVVSAQSTDFGTSTETVIASGTSNVVTLDQAEVLPNISIQSTASPSLVESSSASESAAIGSTGSISPVTASGLVSEVTSLSAASSTSVIDSGSTSDQVSVGANSTTSFQDFATAGESISPNLASSISILEAAASQIMESLTISSTTSPSATESGTASETSSISTQASISPVAEGTSALENIQVDTSAVSLVRDTALVFELAGITNQTNVGALERTSFSESTAITSSANLPSTTAIATASEVLNLSSTSNLSTLSESTFASESANVGTIASLGIAEFGTANVSTSIGATSDLTSKELAHVKESLGITPSSNISIVDLKGEIRISIIGRNNILLVTYKKNQSLLESRSQNKVKRL